MRASGARRRGDLPFEVEARSSRPPTFYLRPTNARAEDQVAALAIRHSTFRIPTGPGGGSERNSRDAFLSHTWISKAGKWTKIRIEVEGDHARLFVHGQSRPTLVVSDLEDWRARAGRNRPVDPRHHRGPLPRRTRDCVAVALVELNYDRSAITSRNPGRSAHRRAACWARHRRAWYCPGRRD